MTREEAIKTLQELWRETNDSWYELEHLFGFSSNIRIRAEYLHTYEAYDLAIEALKAEPIRCGECENYIDRRCIEANHHVAAHGNCMNVFGAKRREK